MNIILRHDFEGSESRLRYGSVTNGSLHDINFGQTLGNKWSSGQALLSYDYLDSTPLSAKDRRNTDTVPQPFTVLPEQVRHGVFLTAEQAISPSTSVFADGTYSHRSTYFDIDRLDIIIQRTPASVDSYGGTVGLRGRSSHGTEFNLSGSFSGSDTDQQLFNLATTPDTLQQRYTAKSSVGSVDIKLDGPLFDIAGGSVKYAVGGQYRRETFDLENKVPAGAGYSPARNVAAGFIETYIPLLGPQGADGTIDRLSLDLADRLEHYSDFGSTNNPKIGLVWQPLQMLSVRATYGTSFKAPLLNDTNGGANTVLPYPLFDPTTGANTNSLVVFGGNPNLDPEKARTWTTGLDVRPEEIPGLRASATYYNIRFTQMITIPQGSISLLDALRDASLPRTWCDRPKSVTDIGTIVCINGADIREPVQSRPRQCAGTC